MWSRFGLKKINYIRKINGRYILINKRDVYDFSCMLTVETFQKKLNIYVAYVNKYICNYNKSRVSEVL